ncbi:MAG: coenzyme F420-0:L-glutamate ligase [candidate division Zixibacteria bacterium]|nr:coenzyme F420-0:L-glutamate ligase [candidate division Zixibacteria bacterium]
MQLFGVRTRLVKPKDDLVGIILEAMTRQKLTIDDGDVLVLASKVVSMAQGLLTRLDTIEPSEKAKRLAEKYALDSRFAEVVLSEADEVYGGVSGALLTLKDSILIANAGVDRKNAPVGFVVLWPEHPHASAEKIRATILERADRRVGVLIVDSRVTPLRMGTTGIAIGIAGFKPIRDCRAKKDLYGKEVRITRHALADDLAGAAHLVMGETEARMPVVLAKQVPVSLVDEADSDLLLIAASECLFLSCFV